MKYQINQLQQLLTNLIYTGIHPALPLVECRRVKLLNTLAVLCVPFFCIYLIVNVLNQNYLLALLNVVNLASLGLLLVMHQRRRYLAARLIRISISITVLSVAGIFFHTGTEFALVGTLVVTVLVFDHKWVLLGLCAIISMAVVGILASKAYMPSVQAVGPLRTHFTALIALAFIVVSIFLYKRIEMDYQRTIERQQEALLSMNREKEKLLSIISHDIKSPLQGLERMLSLYHADLIEGKDMIEGTGALQKKISQLNGTVDTLLSWCLLGMNGIQTRPSHFEVGCLIRETLEFSAVALQIKSIQVIVQQTDGLMIYADRDQLSVVLRNLLSNSIKFSHENGSINLVVVQQEQQVVVSVKDYGVGIAADVLPQLFSSHKDPAYGTSGERGSGLGLLLCSEFVSRNNGFISVESIQGSGACFSVFLPLGSTESGLQGEVAGKPLEGILSSIT